MGALGSRVVGHRCLAKMLLIQDIRGCVSGDQHHWPIFSEYLSLSHTHCFFATSSCSLPNTALYLGNTCYMFILWVTQGKSISCLFLLFSHSVVSDSLRPHGLQHSRLPCPSPSPGICSNSCLWSQWCHPATCHPLLLLLSIFPSIRVFPMSWLLASGGQSIGGSASAK